MESSDWTKLFKLGVHVHDQPDQSVIQFAKRSFRNADKKQLPTKVLDLGCGYGRHMDFLLRHGAIVAGLDSSPFALQMAKDKLDGSGNPSAFILVNSDVAQLPFPTGCFDCLISTKVLQHNTLPEQRLERIVLEMARVLRKKGQLQVTAASMNHKEFGLGREIASNTFEILEGRRKGVIQHFFEKAQLRRLFEGCGFDVSSISPHDANSNLALTGKKR